MRLHLCVSSIGSTLQERRSISMGTMAEAQAVHDLHEFHALVKLPVGR
jgi:hypothetical protein